MNHKINKVSRAVAKVVSVGVLVFAATQVTLAQDESVVVIDQTTVDVAALKKEHRSELAELRLEQIRAENPELAAEMEALKAEKAQLRAERDAEFKAKYPLLAAQKEENRSNRIGLKKGRKASHQGSGRKGKRSSKGGLRSSRG